MRYEYAKADGTTCEIEMPMAADKPERIIVTAEGWKPTSLDTPDVFRRVFTVPATAGVVPTNRRGGHRVYRNNSGTLNIPSHMDPVSGTMPPVFDRGELKRHNGREIQEFKDGTMATVERDPETGQRRGGYPILDNAKNADRWAKKLGVVNQAK